MPEEGFITLVEKFLAKKGAEFIFSEPPQGCKECSLYKVCVGNSKLEVGRHYTIVEVRKKTHLCPATEIQLVVVRVKEALYEAVVPKKYAVEGLTFIYTKKLCGEKCLESGLKDGDKVSVVKIVNSNKNFTRILVRRLPPSPSSQTSP